MLKRATTSTSWPFGATAVVSTAVAVFGVVIFWPRPWEGVASDETRALGRFLLVLLALFATCAASLVAAVVSILRREARGPLVLEVGLVDALVVTVGVNALVRMLCNRQMPLTKLSAVPLPERAAPCGRTREHGPRA
jgi:hypothetical protein